MVIWMKLVTTASCLHRRIQMDRFQTDQLLVVAACATLTACSYMLPVLFAVEPEKIDGVVPRGAPPTELDKRFLKKTCTNASWVRSRSGCADFSPQQFPCYCD